MKKIINKNFAIFVIALILTILSFTLLSNNIKAEASKISDCDTTLKLAKFIRNSGDAFMNASVEEIFVLNKNSGYDTAGNLLYGITSENNGNEQDISYNSATCMFHAQRKQFGWL